MDKLRIEVKKATAVGAKLAHIFLCIDPSTARQRFIATLFHSRAKPPSGLEIANETVRTVAGFDKEKSR